MAKEAKKNNKNLIIGICGAVVAVVIIVVIAIFATKGGNTKIDDSYFVSDDTKYVLTTESDEFDDDDEYAPAKTHLVYNYSGDTITGMTTYLEYDDEASAKAAYEVYKATDDQEGVKSINLNGKYVVVEMTEENYKDVTASDIKSQIDFMEMIKNMDIDDYEDEE